MLSFALRYFGRAIIFVHRKDLLINWRNGTRAMKVDAPSATISHRPKSASLHIPLNQPSVFKTVVDSYTAPAIRPTARKAKSMRSFAKRRGRRRLARIGRTSDGVRPRDQRALWRRRRLSPEPSAARQISWSASAEAGDAYERIVRERLAAG